MAMAIPTAGRQPQVLRVEQEQTAPVQNTSAKLDVCGDVLHYITLIALIAIAALVIAEVLPAAEAGIAMVSLSAVLMLGNCYLACKDGGHLKTAGVRTVALIAALVVGSLIVSGGLAAGVGSIGVLVPVGLAFVVKAVSDKKLGSPIADACAARAALARSRAAAEHQNA